MSRTGRLRSAFAAPATLAAPGALSAKHALPAPALTARCGGRVQVSDGTHFLHAVVNKKAVEKLIQAKQDAMINSIASVRIMCSSHPKFPAQKLAFIQSLEILQEGVDKIGDPQKYEPEGMAKATSGLGHCRAHTIYAGSSDDSDCEITAVTHVSDPVASFDLCQEEEEEEEEVVVVVASSGPLRCELATGGKGGPAAAPRCSAAAPVQPNAPARRSVHDSALATPAQRPRTSAGRCSAPQPISGGIPPVAAVVAPPAAVQVSGATGSYSAHIDRSSFYCSYRNKI